MTTKRHISQRPANAAATTTKAPKGRHDLNHGCNPWAETPTQHKGKPCLLLLLLALCALATTAQAQTYVTGATINNVNYRFYPDGTACVEPSPDAYGTINLVETLNYNSTTYTLTRIGDNAFHGLTTISSITIPNTVTHIGDDAFRGCSGITGTLTLPTPCSTSAATPSAAARASRVHSPCPTDC